MTSRSCLWMKPDRSDAFGFPGGGRRRAVRTALAALMTAIPFIMPVAASAQVKPGGNPGDGTETPSSEPSPPPRECCLVLLLPVGARAVALGQTMVARTAPDGAFANPAGLAELEEHYATVHHASTVAGQVNAVSLLFSPGSAGTIGFSYLLIDHGEIATTDPTGLRTGSLNLRDHLLVASVGTHLVGGLAAGVNAKFYHFRISCNGLCQDLELQTSARALDIGLQFRPTWFPALRLGADITNLGSTLEDADGQPADPLPTRIHVGAAYQILRHMVPTNEMALWLGVEAVGRREAPHNVRVSLGGELSAGEALFLRAGYVPGQGIDSGTAVGLGLRYARFRLAVAKMLGSGMIESETEPFQLTLTMRL